MFRFPLLLSTLMVLLAACNDSKTAGNAKAEEKPNVYESAHSQPYLQSVNAALAAYDSLSEAFVQWDSLRIIREAEILQHRLDSLQTDPSKDGPVAANLSGSKRQSLLEEIGSNKDITTKRMRFNDLTLELFGYLKSSKYDQTDLYLHECTMPYNDQGSGVWISRSEKGRNPYLGLRHPRYKKGMLHCGKVKEELHPSAAGPSGKAGSTSNGNESQHAH